MVLENGITTPLRTVKLEEFEKSKAKERQAAIEENLRYGMHEMLIKSDGDRDTALHALIELKLSLKRFQQIFREYSKDISKRAEELGRNVREIGPTDPERREEYSYLLGNIIRDERKRFFRTQIDKYLEYIQSLLLQLEREILTEEVSIPFGGKKISVPVASEKRGRSSINNLRQEIQLVNDIGIVVAETIKKIDQVYKEIQEGAGGIQPKQPADVKKGPGWRNWAISLFSRTRDDN